MRQASPAELRATGLVVGRLGAGLMQLADAVESGDDAERRRVAEEVLRLYAGLAQLAVTIGELSPEAADLAADGVHAFAKEYLAPADQEEASETIRGRIALVIRNNDGTSTLVIVTDEGKTTHVLVSEGQLRDLLGDAPETEGAS